MQERFLLESNWLRRLMVLAVVLAVVCTGMAGSPRPMRAATLPAISVVGNHFVDGNGTTIRLLGVNRSGSEYMCTGGGNNVFDGPSSDTSITAMASWHINAVRLGLNEDCWLGINGLPVSPLTSTAYQAAIVDYVNRLHLQGLYAILDLHWNAPGAYKSMGQQVMADADHGPAFWTSVASTFKGDSKTLFDLYNEPQGVSWTCLLNGCSATYQIGNSQTTVAQTAGMQSLVNAVRATGASNPLLVGGLGYAGDLSQWLSFKPTDPDSSIVASFHTYNFAGNCNSLSCASTLLSVAATTPIVTGELGETDCSHAYIDTYMPWADANGISYVGWAWNPYGCGFPSLITAYDGTPSTFGLGFRDHLAALAAVHAPTVISVAPSSGPAAGGTSVTVTGSNFTGATAVKFGAVAAASFTVNSATQITATSPAGTGPVDVTVTSSTGTSATNSGDIFVFMSPNAVSTQQYHLSNSDGATWTEIDPLRLRAFESPTVGQPVLVTANADLFTANAGYNQDLGIFVSDNGGGDQLLAWKESGGFAGTFSPNAAYVQALYNMTSGHSYVFKLKWKTNKPASGATIYAGAGGGPYSPTSLIAQTFGTGAVSLPGVSTMQYTLANSDGTTWQPVDLTNLSTTLSPGADATAVLGANADLFTGSAGYNQDLGIFVSDNGGPDTLVAWKESGGFAGTFSPNAAFVKATYAMTGTHTYVFTLKWKTNKPASGATIFAGAGGGPYSPTSLIAESIASGANPYGAVSTTQHSLSGSDGSTWQVIDAGLNVTVSPGANTNSIVGANADLFTANAGYNQDLGIFVSDNGGPDTLVAWKESGGFAGTFSPNAAYVQAAYPMLSGHSYVFKLKWKTNRNAPGTSIFAGAGGPAPFSPTRLIVELTS